jgi:putative transposase
MVGNLDGPSGVAAPDGDIYVADGHGGTTNDRIAKFAKDGKFIVACGHGELAPRILGQGTTVKAEKLSYKAWQRQRCGKSLKVRAPGMFVRMLERKAATGGELIEFGTRNTCLSQFCHVDGTYEKKPLRQRYHQFPEGTRVGRDLYSAFLARYVRDGCRVAVQATNAWTYASVPARGIGRI